EAFKATLEELEYADLLLHVIDVSNPQWQQQAAIVESLIRELKADHIPCLRVYNKCDLAFSGQRSAGEDTVSISAKTGRGCRSCWRASQKAGQGYPPGDPAPAL
ncbi:GTP-binding proten HflX, partial [human gut metagenome]